MNSIYKYMPHYDGSFFDNFLLRATPRNELNDPFEFLPSKEFIDAIFNTEIPGQDTSWVKKMPYDELVKGFQPNAGVISFTETKSNLLMWSHYSQRHTGIVIEFDTENEFFKDLRRVKYDNFRPSGLEITDDSLFIKSDEWIYEKEHRIVKQMDKHDYYINRKDNSINPPKKSATHYPGICEEMYMFVVPKKSIKSVTFGCKIEKKIRATIMDKIAFDKELDTSLTLWDSKLSKEYFHLEFEEVKYSKTNIKNRIL